MARDKRRHNKCVLDLQDYPNRLSVPDVKRRFPPYQGICPKKCPFCKYDPAVDKLEDAEKKE